MRASCSAFAHIGGLAAWQKVRRRRRKEIDPLGVFAKPCLGLRPSMNDHDVALAPDPLFTAEAEFHSVLHRASRTAPSRPTGSALTGRQPYGDTLKSVPNRRGSRQRGGSGGYQCAPVLGSRSFWWPSPRALASRGAVRLMT